MGSFGAETRNLTAGSSLSSWSLCSLNTQSRSLLLPHDVLLFCPHQISYLKVTIHIALAESGVMPGQDFPEEGAVENPDCCNGCRNTPPFLPCEQFRARALDALSSSFILLIRLNADPQHDIRFMPASHKRRQILLIIAAPISGMHAARLNLPRPLNAKNLKLWSYLGLHCWGSSPHIGALGRWAG